MSKDKKIRIPVWIYPSTETKVNDMFKGAHCKSPSEFIEKAINYYAAHLTGENNSDYLAQTMTEIIQGVIKSTEDRISRMQFKEAVELAKIVRMIAPLCEIDEDDLRQLHIDCVDEVKRINGVIKLDSVLRGEV